MTVRIAYELTPQARVSAGRAGQVQNSRQIHEVLPGTVIRGALGAAWWIEEPGDQSEFDALFATQMAVQAAVPQRDGEQAGFTPLSWASCKYPREGCDQSFHDQAVIWARTNGDAAAGWIRTCPNCGLPVELAKRGWNVPAEWGVETTRTALTNGVAATGQLFTRRALAQQVSYRGTLVLEDPSSEAVKWLEGSRTVRVGGQRSTMGACIWSARRQRAQDPAPTTGKALVVLRSPAVLIDSYGAPSVDLAAAIRGCLGDLPGDVAKTWTRPETISGWHGMSGLPKPQEWALAAGSVALLTGTTAEAEERLSRGLGLRRAEGFGEVELRPIQANDDGTRPRRTTTATVEVGDQISPEDGSSTTPDPNTEPAADEPATAPLTEVAASSPVEPVPAPAQAALREPRSVPGVPAAKDSAPGPAEALVLELQGAIPEHLRAQTLRSVLGEARMFNKLRTTRPELVSGRAAGLEHRSWLRDLTGRAPELIKGLLTSALLPDGITALERLIGEGK